jgi:D-alanyl-D-alanine carboxypeptidase
MTTKHPAREPVDPTSGDVTENELRAALEQAVVDGLPGIAAAIATPRGLLWTAAAGWADIDRQRTLDHRHIFGAGSITKVLVASVVLQLAEQERGLLQRSVLEVLGERVTRGIANARWTTLEQLLRHASGIPSWEDDPRWIRAGRGVDLDTTRRWGKSDTLEYIRGHGALFEPGARYSYSNTNHTLLGLAIEQLTGSTAEAQIRRRLLDPLAMSSSSIEGFEPTDGSRLPRRYHAATPEFVRAAGIHERFHRVGARLIDVSASNLSVEWTAGGLISTPTDLTAFALALRTGQILSEAGMHKLTQWTHTGENSEVGCGVFRFQHAAGPLVGHTGNVLGFSSCMFWDMNSEAVFAVCSNAGSMHAGDDVPNAGSTALRSPFTALALRFARQAA